MRKGFELRYNGIVNVVLILASLLSQPVSEPSAEPQSAPTVTDTTASEAPLEPPAEPSPAPASRAPEPAPVETLAVDTPPPAPRTFTPESGLDFSVGLGAPFAGIGVSAGWSFAAGSLFHIVPRVALGWFPGSTPPHGENTSSFGFAAGVLTSVGKRHRLVLDANYGMLARETLTLNGYSYTRSLWGASALLG